MLTCLFVGSANTERVELGRYVANIVNISLILIYRYRISTLDISFFDISYQ